uniref:Uncharacterized protein n=1 Tax=Macrostomum lignano TaxID=282301 RepID=A0A1I8GJ46_9PLAT
MKPQKLSSLPT